MVFKILNYCHGPGNDYAEQMLVIAQEQGPEGPLLDQALTLSLLDHGEMWDILWKGLEGP